MSQAGPMQFRPGEYDDPHRLIDEIYVSLSRAAQYLDQLNRKYPTADWKEGFTAQAGNFKASVNINSKE